MNAAAPAASARPPLMPLDQALAALLAQAAPLAGVESVSSFEADGRVLAADVVSALQVPPQDNASMDGYAVRCAEAAARHGFASGKSTHADRLATIRDTFDRLGVMIDTHTADGLKVAREHLAPGVPMIVLETALPIKFAETIVEALGREPDRPARFVGIEALPKRVQVLPADAAAVKAFIMRHCD